MSRADTRRLNYLEENGSRVDYDVEMENGKVVDLYKVYEHTSHGRHSGAGRTLRKAIDQAIRTTRRKG